MWVQLYYLKLAMNYSSMETMKYLCIVVKVSKLSFPANECKRIGHTKAQLKPWGKKSLLKTIHNIHCKVSDWLGESVGSAETEMAD